MVVGIRETAGSTAPQGATSVVDRFWGHVRARAHLPAMYSFANGAWHPITWGQFGEQARRIAAYLVSEGLPTGTHVAIWSQNRPEWHIADAGMLTVRLCTTPVYHSLSPAEATYVLGHSETAVAFVDSPQILSKLLSIRGDLPALRRIVLFDSAEAVAENGLVISFAEAMARGEAALRGEAGAEVDRRLAAIAPDDIATLVYTSGTTGPFKAVMITHRNIASAIDTLTGTIPVTPDDRVLSYLPLAHIAERVASEFRQYAFGNATHFATSIAMLGEHLLDLRPTFFVGVPRVWEKMAQRVEQGIDELPQPRRFVARWALAKGRAAVAVRESGRSPGPWQRATLAAANRLVLHRIRAQMGLDQATVLITTAAPLSPDVLRFLHAVGLDVCELYGMSENTGVTSVNPMGHARIGTVGPPLPGVDVSIAEDGEILVRCDAVFAGYYKDEDATRVTVVDGWLHTGDAGEFDEEGYLRITDRKKDLIITAGGKNIAPANLEVALKDHPLISNAVVIGDRRPYVTALLTLDAEQAAEFARHHGLPTAPAELARSAVLRDEVQRHVDTVNAGLAQVEQVKRWQLLPEDFTIGQELTPTFKVRRRVVAERYAAQIEANYG